MRDITEAMESGALAEPDVRHWHLRRIDIRSPVLKDAWPVARIELEHPLRGRVSDIGTAPGAFDAAFVAAKQIIGVYPHLLSYNVRSGPPGEEGALPITIEVEIELDGGRFAGSASGVDLVRCSLEAWLDAVAKSDEE
jgi:2-isopropylmalate synthase